MKKIIQKIKDFIKNYNLKYELKEKIKEAEALAAVSGRAYYILSIDEKIYICSHADIQKMCNNKIFGKYAESRIIESKAIYRTAKQYDFNMKKELKRTLNLRKI